MQSSSRLDVTNLDQAFMIFVENLPGSASWQSLKDLLRSAGINAEHTEFDKKSLSGYVRLYGEDNFKRAFNFLQNEQWMGRRMRPWILPGSSALASQVFLSPNYQPDPQYQQFQYTYNVRRPSLPANLSQANTILPSDTFYPGMVLQDHAVYCNPVSPSATYTGYTVPVSPYPLGLATRSYSPSLSTERDAREPVLGSFVHTEACGIHIKNLPNSITELKIRGLVAQSLSVSDDKITAVELPMRDGAPKGYAVVVFQERKLVNLAIEALDGIKYDGQKLKVKQDQDQKVLRDAQSTHPSIGGYDVPSVAVGSFYNNTSKHTVHTDALDASHSPSTAMGTLGRPSQSGRRSTSCSRELSNSSRTHSTADMGELSRRLSDLGMASPPVVDGSKSRLMGSASTNEKNKKARKLGSGSTSRPGGSYNHSQGVHDNSPSAGYNGSENLKGSKKRR